MKYIFYLLIVIIVSSCNSKQTNLSKEKNQLPNIIIIYTDDQGYGDLSSYGSMSMKTPNIDGLGANGVNNAGTQWWNNGSLTVNGVKIFVCQGMSANVMFAAQRSNLYFGTGLLNNMQEVRVLDMQDLDGSQNARFIMRFTAGVQYGISEDLVYYS